MSKYNWPALIEAFKYSGQSQAQFCKENNINPKYFNLKYSQHRSKQSDDSSFVKADIEVTHSSSTLELHVGRCKIICPEAMPIQSFVALIHQLA